MNYDQVLEDYVLVLVFPELIMWCLAQKENYDEV